MPLPVRRLERPRARSSEQPGSLAGGSGHRISGRGSSLDVDRFERVTSELFRLQRRLEMNRSQVEATIEEQHVGRAASVRPRRRVPNLLTARSASVAKSGTRAFKSHWYAAAISFLGLVEFLANAPVFGALLPRDPLTEQQIRLCSRDQRRMVGWRNCALSRSSFCVLMPRSSQQV